MKSVMQHSFANVPAPQVPRSVFNRSCGHKLTMNEDYLVPIYVDEVLPGDTFKMSPNYLARIITPVVPIMDNVFFDTFFFFVPNRLIWDNWENFITGATSNTVPVVELHGPNGSSGDVDFEDIYDYFGLRPQTMGGVGDYEVNSLPFRAYQKIYNDWFRDENLCSAIVIDTGDGPDAHGDFALKKRCKKHDYFTSCLPWPQKGSAVEIPLGTTAPVMGTEYGLPLYDGNELSYAYHQAANNIMGVSKETTSFLSGAAVTGVGPARTVRALGVFQDDSIEPGLFADLSEASAATINSLRQAFQLQRMLEKDARGGTRYVETLRVHFGVISPDARLQRAEYLSGSSQRIAFTSVPQTSESGTTVQGTLAAYGTVFDNGGRFQRSFVEHGYIIGLANIRADLTYQQGINRMWWRQTRFDFYWPGLAYLGEQEVLQREIFTAGDSTDDDIFGYQERYAEYRYNPSRISGHMRSDSTLSLDVWHLSDDYSAAPSLNQSFIESQVPISRITTVVDESHFKVDCYFDVLTTRCMPVQGVPGLIDHF